MSRVQCFELELSYQVTLGTANVTFMDTISHWILIRVGFPILLIGTINKSWRAALLSWFIGGPRMLCVSNRLPKTQAAVDCYQVTILLDRKAAWTSTRPALDCVENFKVRAAYAQSAVAIYWMEGRFEEARDAACYWEQAARLSLGDKANDVREFFRKWGPEVAGTRVRREVYTERRSRGDMRPPEVAPATIKDMMALYQRYSIREFNHYQDAYISLSLIQWAKTQAYEPARRSLPTLKVEQFLAFLRIKFDRHLAVSMGMDEATIERMYAFDIPIDES